MTKKSSAMTEFYFIKIKMTSRSEKSSDQTQFYFIKIKIGISRVRDDRISQTQYIRQHTQLDVCEGLLPGSDFR